MRKLISFLLSFLIPTISWITVYSVQPQTKQILSQANQEGKYPAYYLVFELHQSVKIKLISSQSVNVSTPYISLSDAEMVFALHQADTQNLHLSAMLETTGGKLLYQTIVEVPLWQRAEFAGEMQPGGGFAIDGQWLKPDVLSFVVRLPAIERNLDQVRLIIKSPDQLIQAEFQIEDQINQTSPIEKSQILSQVTSLETGSPANRIDILVMGDGYSSPQQTQFIDDSSKVMDEFFNITPYKEYKNYFNVTYLFNPSPQSGADHPPYEDGCSSSNCCGDPEMKNDPLQGTFVDTAFDAKFCTSNIHRLLAINTSKAFSAAAAVADWDLIILIVNDTTYGGSGGTISVTSTHPFSVGITQHEFGHSFAQLADEYEYGGSSSPTCSDKSSKEPCPKNVTDVIDRVHIKWSSWISDTTPLPTSETDPLFENVVGLYEGSVYWPTGIYRSGQDCLMRNLGRPFCQLPTQINILRMYDGGWGVPSGGVESIEPGSTIPDDSILLPANKPQEFRFSILEPVGGPPASIQWYVNSVLINGENSPSFIYTPAPGFLGEVEIKVTVTDATTLVHPAMSGNSLTDSHTWKARFSLLPEIIFVPSIQKNK